MRRTLDAALFDSSWSMILSAGEMTPPLAPQLVEPLALQAGLFLCAGFAIRPSETGWKAVNRRLSPVVCISRQSHQRSVDNMNRAAGNNGFQSSP